MCVNEKRFKQKKKERKKFITLINLLGRLPFCRFPFFLQFFFYSSNLWEKWKKVHLLDAIQLNRLSWYAFFVIYRGLLGSVAWKRSCVCVVNSMLFTLLRSFSLFLSLSRTLASQLRFLFLSFARCRSSFHSQRQHSTHTCCLDFVQHSFYVDVCSFLSAAVAEPLMRLALNSTHTCTAHTQMYSTHLHI